MSKVKLILMVQLPGKTTLQMLFMGRPPRALTCATENDDSLPRGRSMRDWGFCLLLCLQKLVPEVFCFITNFLNELSYTDVQSRNLVNVDVHLPFYM